MNDDEEIMILVKMSKKGYESIKNLDVLEANEGIFPAIAAFNMFVDAVWNGKLVEVKGDLIDRSELEKAADEYLDKITSPLINHCTTYDVYHIIEMVKPVVKFDEEEKE